MLIGDYELLRWLHVAVMGYWLGSDMVVNAVTHYFKNARELSVTERGRLWDFLLLIDQHPRNALILSIPLGFSLAAERGFLPLSRLALLVVWLASLGWFVYIWILHWRRDTAAYALLSRVDLGLRWALAVALLVLGGASLRRGGLVGPPWLGLKLVLFAGVILCGLVIRRYIAAVVRVLPELRARGSTPAVEARISHALDRGTYTLWVLWILLVAIGYLGVAKPLAGA